MGAVGIFYGHLVYIGHWAYFVAVWCILWLFEIFFPVLVCFAKKNLATLTACNSIRTLTPKLISPLRSPPGVNTLYC
jgi:hypothetical protein